MLSFAVVLIVAGWILLRKAKKLEAAHHVPESPPDDGGTPDPEKGTEGSRLSHGDPC